MGFISCSSDYDPLLTLSPTPITCTTTNQMVGIKIANSGGGTSPEY